ncbi:MAG TPA: hypothetical protein VIJ51_01800, partial [Solirubrobacteraceae bacterium]
MIGAPAIGLGRRAAVAALAATASVLLGMLLVADPVAADISPPGCTNNSSSLSLNKDKIVVRNGDTIHYSADFENDTPGGCDVTNATTTLTVPAPDGTASGPTTTLATGQSFPEGTPREQVGATVSYVVNVDPGVTQIFATDQLTGTLHDFPVGGSPDTTQKANTVSVTVTQPHTTLTKSASPTSGKAPLPVTYTYTETNDGTNAPINGVTLTDSNCSPVTFVGGDTGGDGILSVGETWTYTCSKTLTTAGIIPNTATATGTDLEDGNPAPAETATASVTVAPATPGITTLASSAAPVAPATNPTISDTATLTGGSSPTGTIQFQIFGPDDTTCGKAPIFSSVVAVAGNGTYTASPFTVLAPGTYRFEASYSGDPSNAAIPATCNGANESVSFPPPELAVSKSAAPLSRPEPGGAFTFTVAVTNPSATDPVKITSLLDNIYGDLSTRAGSTCGGLIGLTLAPGATSPSCTFTGNFTGVAGDSQTDIVTATGIDSNGFTPPPATAHATVTITPLAVPALVTTVGTPAPPHGAVTDAANLTGGTTPSGTITFEVFGPDDATCATSPAFTSTVPVSGNGTYTSSAFTPPSPGTYRFVASYSGDTNNKPVVGTCNEANESVTLPPPLIGVTKSATPPSLPQPGGTFTFTVTVNNPSTIDPVTITSLLDNIYGDLSTRAGSTCGALIGTTLAPGATSAPCSFPGPFTGVAGDSQTDIVTVTGIDSNGFTPPPATAHATVTITPRLVPTLSTTAAGPVPPHGAISDTANLGGGANPTGTITFMVFGPDDAGCSNPPAFTQTVTVAGDGGYSSGTFTPPAPGTYRFVADYSGDAANAPVLGTCNEPNELVTVPAPVIAVTKTASPLTLPQPGGTFTFTVTVNNPSATDA